MGFGKNPHVAKAQAAEQKAEGAMDRSARESAWREAARQWDRAAERETDAKKKLEYDGRAESARSRADHGDDAGATSDAPESKETRTSTAQAAAVAKPNPKTLN